MPDLTTKPHMHDTPLGEPSYAAQALTVTARILDMRPTDALAPTALDDAIRTGLRSIVATLPPAVRADVHRIVWAALPQASLTDTHAEYALRLRVAAKGL